MKQTTIKNTPLLKMVYPLLQWYDHHARILPWRECSAPYPVWISEIMLQQTRVEAVKPYFNRWMKALPDLASLANASEQEVLKLWEGLGYYSRVRNIHKAAKLIMEQHGGKFPASYDALRGLPGIGAYTAGAIGSIAFELPVACVDGNVLRVLARLTAEESDIGAAATKRLITESITEIIPKERPGDFNQAIMELGATICLPNGLPKCQICPLSFLCDAYRQNRMMEFPVKGVKPPRRIEKKTVLILIHENRVALRKRPETGLLAGLWEFPNYPGELTEKEIRQILSQEELSPLSLVSLGKSKHIFTHIQWDMSGYLAYVENKNIRNSSPYLVEEDGSNPSPPLNFHWFDTGFPNERITLPSAFKPYSRLVFKDAGEPDSGKEGTSL